MTPLPGVRRLVHRSAMPSTQDLARRLAEAGAEPWTLVWADRQSRGRGRMERRWSSAPGGLYFSLILRPKIAPAKLASLSLAAAAATARALSRATGLKTMVKPPNDVLAAPSHSPANNVMLRKVCGLLLEASGDTRSVHWLIIGVGVNVNNRLPASLRAAASLAQLAGRRFKPREILERVLAALGRLPLKNGRREKSALR